MILKGSMFSQVLEMDTSISIFIPNVRAGHSQKYKVIYLLHGLCGNSDNWLDNTMLPVYANNYHAVFVMPEVGRSFYTDMQYGQRYFSYIMNELPSICKNIFNISAEREDTIVIGASMGGYGALKCALTKPEQYGLCCAFSSGCLFLKDFLASHRKFGDTAQFQAEWGRQFVADFKAVFGVEREWRPEYEIMELAKRTDAKELKPKIYVTCGTNDGLLDINRQFRDEMQSHYFDFTYEEWSGGHDWYYFNEALKRALAFCLGNV